MRIPTVFIILIHLYNVDMTFKNRLATINFNCKRALTFSINFLILASPAPLK